jgi:hypothetical protein
MAARLMVELIGDSTSAVTAMSKTKTAAGQTETAAKKTGISLGSVAKAVATGYAVTKILEFGKSTLQVTSDAMAANHRLEATYHAAGDATGQLAKHAEGLAESLGKSTGVSPTVIKNAEAILTTFHAVSNQTAVTAGIFDRATAAAGDLAAAGFGDAAGNAKLLGKALQDPTQGMGALRRAGVNLSAAQIDQIKNMQKSGDLLGAQKILLKEVEGQVKGTAAATATSGAKSKVAYEEMQVAIGQSLMPAVKVFKGELTGLFNFVSANASWLVPLIVAVTGFAVAVVVVSKSIALFSTAIKGMQLAIEGAKIAWLLLNLAFSVSPIGVIILAVMAVIAVLVLLYVKVDWFRAFVNTAMSAIVGFFVAGWNAVTAIFSWFSGWLTGWGGLIVAIIFGPFGLAMVIVNAFVRGGISGVLSMFAGWVGAIGGVLAPVVNVVSWPFRQAWSLIQSGVIGPMTSAWGAVVGAISAAFSGVYGAITGPFISAWHFIESNIIGPLKSAWNGVAHAINSVHVSFTIPSNPVTDFLHIGGQGFEWSPPFRIPTLQRGGLVTRTGFILAHAGEAVTPLPPRARALAGAGGGPLVAIGQANFGERVDVDVFGRRLAWALTSRGM